MSFISVLEVDREVNDLQGNYSLRSFTPTNFRVPYSKGESSKDYMRVVRRFVFGNDSSDQCRGMCVRETRR